MRGHPDIYRTVEDIHALSIEDVPDLVQQHLAEIVVRLAQRNRGTAQSAPSAGGGDSGAMSPGSDVLDGVRQS